VHLHIIAPFPLVEDYGSSMRVISELKAIEYGLDRGYFDDLDIKTIRVFTYSIAPNYVRYLSKLAKIVKVEFYTLPHFLVNAFRMGFNVKRIPLDSYIIEKLISKTKLAEDTLLYCHTNIPLFYLGILPYISNFKIILDLHGVLTYEINRPLNTIIDVIETRLLKEVDTFVFSNVSTEYCLRSLTARYNDIINHNDEKFKSIILPDMVDTNIFRSLNPDYVAKVKKRMGLQGKFIIIYTGSLTQVQGVDMLIEAFPLVKEQIPNACLVIGGGRWTPNVYYAYAKIAKKYKDSILLKPSVNYLTELNTLLNIADIAVSPKLSTCQSNQKVLVYAAVGKPVVTFRTLANEFLLKENAFYADKISSQYLASAIYRAYEALISKAFDSSKLVNYVKSNFSTQSPPLLDLIHLILSL